MAYAVINQASGAVKNATTITPLNITITAPTNGNTMFCAVFIPNNTVSLGATVSSTGVTWTRDVLFDNHTNNTGYLQMWRGTGVSGAGTTVAITPTATESLVAYVAEVSGMGATPAFDIHSTNFDVSGTNSVFPTQTITTSFAQEISFAAYAFSNNIGNGDVGTLTVNNGFTVGLKNQVNIGTGINDNFCALMVAWKILSVAGAVGATSATAGGVYGGDEMNIMPNFYGVQTSALRLRSLLGVGR